MVEIHGQLAVTFKIRSESDVQRIIEFSREFEGAPVMVQPAKRDRYVLKNRLTKKESQDRIIKLLKETFPRDGFMMSDAAPVVLQKLGLRETSIKHALGRARKEGIVLLHGKMYVWTEVLQEKVASRIQDQPQASEPVTEQPIAQAPQVV